MRFAMAPFATLGLVAACMDTAAAVLASQPPVGQQAVEGPDNLTQTYFFAAESDKLSNGVPDSLQLSFQIGSFFGPAFAPSEYFVVVSGNKAGVPFSKYLLDPNDTVSITDYSGNWGVGTYEGTAGWSSVHAMVYSPEKNVKGYINLAQSTGPPAWGCGANAGTNMDTLITPSSSAAEIAMYKGTSWAHFASGQARVKFNIDDIVLDFTGPFESETSYGPPYQDIYSRFIYGFTTVGPYDIAFWHVAPQGEPNNRATVGYLAKSNHLIVNKCNRVNSSNTDSTRISGTGSFSVAGIPQDIPEGLLIDYSDSHGRQYQFSIDTLAAAGASLQAGTTVSAQATAKGGVVGGPVYNGSTFLLYFAALGNSFL